MKNTSSSQLTGYWRLQPSTEWFFRILIWDFQNGHILSMLLINIIIDFGDWSQICMNILMAYMEYSGYIIPQ
jgi:hypothetical protein